MSGIFLKCQSEFLTSMMNEQVTVEEKSRRTGFSWTASFGADLTAARAKNAGGMDVFYLGYNLEMAREFIDYCAEHAAVMEAAASEVHESFWHDPENPEKDTKVFRIDFASGFKILALPSRPRSLRGMQGLVIIDEAAFHDDLEELLKAAIALLMWGGRVVIISTHDGDTNPFNVLVQAILSGKKPYKLLRTTLDDALDDGLYKKMCIRKGEEWSAEAQQKWRDDLIKFYGAAADEELFCIPNPSSGAFIPLALIEARSVPEIPVIRWECKGAFALMAERLREIETRAFCVAEIVDILDTFDQRTSHVFGGDFARSGDLTVFWFMAIEKDTTRNTVLVVELRNVPFEQQKQILHFILDRLPRLRAGKMDATGNGAYLAEVTVQRYGARIEAVKMSENWYREEMPPLKAAFEDATITLPRDQEIHDDIRSLKMVRGVARIPDQRAGSSKAKRHGDAAVAIAMAYAASRADPEEYGYQAAPSPYSIQSETASADTSWPAEREIRDERFRGRTGLDTYGVRGRLL